MRQNSISQWRSRCETSFHSRSDTLLSLFSGYGLRPAAADCSPQRVERLEVKLPANLHGACCGGGQLTKVSVGGAGIQSAENRVIQRIKGVHVKVEVVALGDAEALAEAGI